MALPSSGLRGSFKAPKSRSGLVVAVAHGALIPSNGIRSRAQHSPALLIAATAGPRWSACGRSAGGSRGTGRPRRLPDSKPKRLLGRWRRIEMGSRRSGEPVREYLQAVACRAALIFGEQSALVTRETASYMSSLMGPRAPVVDVPEARHHVMLDQPLAFVAALRMLLDSWMQRLSGGKRLYRPISDLTSASWRRILIGG